MEDIVLIGFLGKKGAGKDTAANYLLTTEDRARRYAFADPLKNVCKILFNFTEEQLYGSLKDVVDPRWSIKPRDAFQFIGTEIFREKINELVPGIGNDFWVKNLENRLLLSYKNGERHFVISDVRFPNEVALIHKYKGTVIKIHRELLNAQKKSKPDKNELHLSETNIDKIQNHDVDLLNNKTLEELYTNIDKLCLFSK